MLNAVMTEIKNHFAISSECVPVSFEEDGINGEFYKTYVVGQYVWIKNSVVNDGVYKITAIEGSKITLDGTFTLINTNIRLFALAVPNEFIELVSDISTFSETETVGIKSESLSDMSQTFAGDGGEWEVVYAKKLRKYRRMFDCDERRLL